MKTVKQWLKEGLSEKDYKKAEKYENVKWQEEWDCFGDALRRAFIWEYTQEGGRYWGAIYDEVGEGEILPDVAYWRNRCLLAERCLSVTPCDPDITNEQINSHKAYNQFLETFGNKD